MSDERRIVCPTCTAAGQRSTARRLVHGVTGMGWSPYYDEDGLYHAHDPNWSPPTLECSQGHRWRVASNGCPNCDWGQRDEVIEEPRSFVEQCRDEGHTQWVGHYRMTAMGMELDPYETCSRCGERRAAPAVRPDK